MSGLHVLIQLSERKHFSQKYHTILYLTLNLTGFDNHCASALIDASKAFFSPSLTVDHSLPLQNVSSVGLTRDVCYWFQKYLSDKYQCVKQGQLRVAKLKRTTKKVQRQKPLKTEK